MTRSGTEPTTSRSRGEHSSHRCGKTFSTKPKTFLQLNTRMDIKGSRKIIYSKWFCSWKILLVIDLFWLTILHLFNRILSVHYPMQHGSYYWERMWPIYVSRMYGSKLWYLDQNKKKNEPEMEEFEIYTIYFRLKCLPVPVWDMRRSAGPPRCNAGPGSRTGAGNAVVRSPAVGECIHHCRCH